MALALPLWRMRGIFYCYSWGDQYSLFQGRVWQAAPLRDSPTYSRRGSRPMVILLHRYAETLRMWRPIIPLLEKFSVIVPDLPALRHNNAFDPGLSFRARAFA